MRRFPRVPRGSAVYFFGLFLLVVRPLLADTVNFDDIDASAGDVILTTYKGYSWTNFSAYTAVPGFPGFNNGIVSGPNAAYSSDTGSISAAGAFDFSSASFGSGYYDNLNVTVEGLLAGTVEDSKTISVSTESAQLFTFDFTGIDTLLFTTAVTGSTTDPYNCGAVGCSYFTVDNLGLTPDSHPPPPPSPVPEPPAVILLASGLLAASLLRRQRVAHR